MKPLIKEIPPELKSLHAKFTEWRLHRPSQSQAIPTALLIAADRLIKEHNAKLVMTTLGINHVQLKRVKSLGLKTPVEKRKRSASQPFVEVLPTKHPVPYTVELIRPDGMRMKLSGTDRVVIQEVMNGFIKGESCCN